MLDFYAIYLSLLRMVAITLYYLAFDGFLYLSIIVVYAYDKLDNILALQSHKVSSERFMCGRDIYSS